ncbi:MAG: hypothetical protein ABIP65_00650 [Vicinamibacterales bacterium]
MSRNISDAGAFTDLMSTDNIALTLVITVACVAVGIALVHLAWRTVGAWKIRQAGPRPMLAVKEVLWRDPGAVETLDLRMGPGGADFTPAPPYSFIDEHFGGSQPSVSVQDGRGRRWRVKWGDEVRSETFAVRLVWACGFYTEVTHFVPEGRIDAAGKLQRASACIDDQCRFTDARFELDDPGVTTMFEEHGWAWNDNPFVGSRELQGLKILVMLLSNWDTKDRRDVARGSNMAIFEVPLAGGGLEARYLISDWGGSMGRWGNVMTRGRWDPEGFDAQTAEFVTSASEGIVKFGYAGQRTEDVASGISVDDTRWLCRWLCRLTDTQIADALRASGGNDDEASRFTAALRNRIRQLEAAGASPGHEPG